MQFIELLPNKTQHHHISRKKVSAFSSTVITALSVMPGPVVTPAVTYAEVWPLKQQKLERAATNKALRITLDVPVLPVPSLSGRITQSGGAE